MQGQHGATADQRPVEPQGRWRLGKSQQAECGGRNGGARKHDQKGRQHEPFAEEPPQSRRAGRPGAVPPRLPRDSWPQHASGRHRARLCCHHRDEAESHLRQCAPSSRCIELGLFARVSSNQIISLHRDGSPDGGGENMAARSSLQASGKRSATASTGRARHASTRGACSLNTTSITVPR